MTNCPLNRDTKALCGYKYGKAFLPLGSVRVGAGTTAALPAILIVVINLQ